MYLPVPWPQVSHLEVKCIAFKRSENREAHLEKEAELSACPIYRYDVFVIQQEGIFTLRFGGKMLRHAMPGEGVKVEGFSALAGHVCGFCCVLRCGLSTAIFPKRKEGIHLDSQSIL